MCGIVGVVGSRNATDILMQGLEKLEYRGYDSAGIFVSDGRTSNLVNLLDALQIYALRLALMLLERPVLVIHVGQRMVKQQRKMLTLIPLRQVALFLFIMV